MRRPSSRVLVLAGALFAVAGCQEEQLPLSSGMPSTLAVRAYVDADGDGTYTTGTDQGIGSATVTATGPGGSVEATTDGQGLATFESLEPGSWELSLSGSSPAGAVLATATDPVVVAPYRGESLTAEFRYAFLAGSVTGRVFRDDNENGVFDADADLPAAGIEITLLTVQEEVVQQTTTDATGAYTFDQLRPGSYFVRVTPLETMEIVGSTQQNVVVAGGQATALSFRFTGTLVISVADARSAPQGQTVTVEGVVTWHPSYDTRTYFLQDATAGISVFDFDRAAVAIGDHIQLTGTLGSFAGELQISPVVAVEILDSPGAPEPRAVTGAEINAGQFQGELVTLDGTVQSIDVLSFGNQLVTLQDGAGTDFSVYADSRTGVTEEDWTVGLTFAVTGVLGTDTGNDPAPRVEVRGDDDVVQGGSVIPIADARDMLGESVVIQGAVTWQNSWDERVYFLQDATGGISTFHAGAPTLERGDLVQLRGGVSAFRGEVQISPEDIQILGHGAVPSPRGVTGAQIDAGQFQGELVTVTGVIQQIEVLSFDNQNVTIRDGAGTDFSVYVDSRNGVSSGDWPAEGSTVRVTGVLGTDDRNTPAPRLELRDIDDIQPATMGQLSIAEARAMDGETVTVEGLVTWQQQWDSRVYYFQDETGGLTVFHSSAPDDLAEGERIRVTGTVDQFRSEVEISPVTDFERLGQETPVAARAVTGAQINAGLFQGQLVALTGTLVEVVEISFGNQIVTVRDGAGAEVVVYVDSRNGMTAGDWPAAGSAVTVTGVLTTDDRQDMPFQLEPRRVEDVTVTPGGATP